VALGSKNATFNEPVRTVIGPVNVRACSLADDVAPVISGALIRKISLVKVKLGGLASPVCDIVLPKIKCRILLFA